MEIQADFKELLGLFNASGVEYLIVGGYALAFHGVPRYTGDIDILVRPNRSNAEKVLTALETFGFGEAGLAREDFEIEDKVVQLGLPPVRIDIITSITGVSIDEVFAGCVEGQYGDVPVRYVGRDALIKNKRATGRKKDVADLEALDD